MPGTNNEAARKEEVKKIVENRRRKAELIREQQIKKHYNSNWCWNFSCAYFGNGFG